MSQIDIDSGQALSEVRWGDTQSVALAIPAASTITVATEFKQLVDIRTPHAAVWCVQIGLEVLNHPEMIAPEEMMLDAFLRIGVGSTEWATFRQVTVVAGAFLPIADLIVANIPSTRMNLSARVRVQTPVSAPARTLQARYVLLAAPYGRLRGVGPELVAFND